MSARPPKGKDVAKVRFFRGEWLKQLSWRAKSMMDPRRAATSVFHIYIPTESQPKRRRRARQVAR